MPPVVTGAIYLTTRRSSWKVQKILTVLLTDIYAASLCFGVDGFMSNSLLVTAEGETIDMTRAVAGVETGGVGMVRE